MKQIQQQKISNDEEEFIDTDSESETSDSENSFGAITPNKKRRRSQRFSIGTRTAQLQQQIIESRNEFLEGNDSTNKKSNISEHKSESDLATLMKKGREQNEKQNKPKQQKILASTQSVKDFREEMNQFIVPLQQQQRKNSSSNLLSSKSIGESLSNNNSPSTSNKSLNNMNSNNKSSYEKLFIKYFKLPNDNFIDHTLCCYQQSISIRGRLYISNENICFYSKHYRRVIPMKDIQYLEKQNSSLIFPSGINLVCHTGKKHIFCNIPNRDEIFSLLQTFLPNSANSPASYSSFTLNKSTSSSSLTNSYEEYGQKPQRTKSGQFEAITEKVVQKAKQQLSEVMSPKKETSNQYQDKNNEKEEVDQDNNDVINTSSSSNQIHEVIIYPKSALDDLVYKNFQFQSSDERVFEVCYCYMKQGYNEIYNSGRLYLTQHYLCFQTILSSNCIFFQISYEDILSCEKQNLNQIFPNCIKLQLKKNNEEIYFGFIQKRNQIYSSILNAKSSFNEIDSSIGIIEGKGKDLYRKYFVRTNVVSPNENLIATTRCIISDPVTRRGHLFITENFFCYYVINYKSEIKEIISIISIYKIKKRNNDTLILFTPSNRYILQSVQNIDQIIHSLNEQKNLIFSSSNSSRNENNNILSNSLEIKKNQQRGTIGFYQFSCSSFFMKSSTEIEIDFHDKVSYRLPDSSHSFNFYLYHPWSVNASFVPLEEENLSKLSQSLVFDLIVSNFIIILVIFY